MNDRRSIEAISLPTTSGAREVTVQTLAAEGPAGFRIEAVHLPPGGSLTIGQDEGLEAVVLNGEWSVPGGELHPKGYLRRPGLTTSENVSGPGCTLFVRRGRFDPRDREDVLVPFTTPEDPASGWFDGHGGLRVRPLHSLGTDNAALVHWPAGERFIPHRHWGGEEIFVLSGTFRDEHGVYPRGTWILSPHLSTHHPYVEEETLIYVKTGHLVDQADGRVG